jgi:hypothetical protein
VHPDYDGTLNGGLERFHHLDGFTVSPLQAAFAAWESSMGRNEIARADTADIIFNWQVPGAEPPIVQAECVDLATLSRPTREWSAESIAALARLAEEAYATPANDTAVPAYVDDVRPVGINLHIVRR